jgi:NAD(P)H-hydrate epimerase
LITVEPQPSVYIPVAAQLHAPMVRPWLSGQELPAKCSAILFGPGLAEKDLPAALKTRLRLYWQSFPGAMIVDASALDWLKPGQARPEAIRVVTPHPGEAARLLGTSVGAVQADRVSALREISRRLGGCFVALKGNQTLVGRASGDIFINSSGNPYLAQGGSGDLLSGYLAGLLAQPGCWQNPLTTIRFAVWQHGAAAEESSRWMSNWTMETLANDLGAITPHPP